MALAIVEIISHVDNITKDAHSIPSGVKLSNFVFIEPFWSSSLGCSVVECSLAANTGDVIDFISSENPWLKLSFSSALEFFGKFLQDSLNLPCHLEHPSTLSPVR